MRLQKKIKMSKDRILWVDMVKAIGMFFIVLGHFFPPYISAWIYTFNVPLFFFMSGYLGKKEENWKVFWKKNINGLVVPFLLLSLIINVPYIINNITDGNRLLYLLLGILGGFHSIDGMNGCLNMWFVYCLFVTKLLFQCFYSRKHLHLLILSCCIVGMVGYHMSGSHYKWAVSNVLYAFPYFMLGFYSKQNSIVNIVSVKLGSLKWNISLAALSLLSAFIASHNGIAYTYEGGVGQSLLIMVFCSMVNIITIVRFSYVFQHFKENMMRTISQGSIIILAFHLWIVYPIERAVSHFLKGYPVLECMAFSFSSFVICLMFVPIINFTKKHFPLLMGRR